MEIFVIVCTNLAILANIGLLSVIQEYSLLHHLSRKCQKLFLLHRDSMVKRLLRSLRHLLLFVEMWLHKQILVSFIVQEDAPLHYWFRSCQKLL